MPTERLVLRRPDDWHVHLRDGAMLKAVLPFTARQFARAIVMPNLKPPVADTAAAVAYRGRILAALPEGAAFTPLMTAYLTDGTDPEDLARGFAEGVFAAAKLYPANATTNSAHGVTDTARIEPVLERHRTLRVVLEHATTAEAVAFVRGHAASGRVGATITAHHLLINRSDLFQGGIRPHLYCLPIAKRERHRQALVEAATSGEGPFFLGTDTAPHALAAKEAACGCAGCFTAANALELYALPANEERVVLERRPSTAPDVVLTADGDGVLPFRSGETLGWTFAGPA